ncbi:MAG: hypothetical protein PQJ61_06555 [Spirochaetales bacterium]|uniref:Uncharacterized protein n=1 Tax=Candidatus Thalassospirochaeta sargassi TaxID=3119039 RepID=A0AAJ1IEF8_9SPIO|nr:hypothetical protein [Spirochaetales bacterium]
MIAGCDTTGTITFTDSDGNNVSAVLSETYYGLATDGGIDISFALEEEDGDIWIYGFQLSVDATDISTLGSGEVTGLAVFYLVGGDADNSASTSYPATDISLDYIIAVDENGSEGTVQVSGTITITVDEEDVIQTWDIDTTVAPGNLTNCDGDTGGYAIDQMLYLYDACSFRL